ncbi:hypothetical protein QJS66_14495 [Kocuria rhizophila]|nr:hypothetical protein QJS66_14495 [Kocuria rhizophila]
MTGIFVLAMLVWWVEDLLGGLRGSVPGRAARTSTRCCASATGRDRRDVPRQIWAASFSSVVGVWSGVSLVFADYWATLQEQPVGTRTRGPAASCFNFYLLWLTFPPMLPCCCWSKPVFLILLYGVLGALSMPFLAVALLGLLNASPHPQKWRNGMFTNAVLVVCAVLLIIGRLQPTTPWPGSS